MLNKLIQSAHLFEVILNYSCMNIGSIYFIANVTLKNNFTYYLFFFHYLLGLILGGVLYSFMEYCFHRYLLHYSF